MSSERASTILALQRSKSRGRLAVLQINADYVPFVDSTDATGGSFSRRSLTGANYEHNLLPSFSPSIQHSGVSPRRTLPQNLLARQTSVRGKSTANASPRHPYQHSEGSYEHGSNKHIPVPPTQRSSRNLEETHPMAFERPVHNRMLSFRAAQGSKASFRNKGYNIDVGIGSPLTNHSRRLVSPHDLTASKLRRQNTAKDFTTENIHALSTSLHDETEKAMHAAEELRPKHKPVVLSRYLGDGMEHQALDELMTPKTREQEVERFLKERRKQVVIPPNMSDKDPRDTDEIRPEAEEFFRTRRAVVERTVMESEERIGEEEEEESGEHDPFQSTRRRPSEAGQQLFRVRKAQVTSKQREGARKLEDDRNRPVKQQIGNDSDAETQDAMSKVFGALDPRASEAYRDRARSSGVAAESEKYVFGDEFKGDFQTAFRSVLYDEALDVPGSNPDVRLLCQCESSVPALVLQVTPWFVWPGSPGPGSGLSGGKTQDDAAAAADGPGPSSQAEVSLGMMVDFGADRRRIRCKAQCLPRQDTLKHACACDDDSLNVKRACLSSGFELAQTRSIA
eukprot:1479319-Rhodomonas_salina.1